jgi:hypothetical protein
LRLRTIVVREVEPSECQPASSSEEMKSEWVSPDRFWNVPPAYRVPSLSAARA